MRQVLIAATVMLAASAGAIAASAQTADRYGGVGTYMAPAPQPSAAPGRVLTWAGKTIPQQQQAYPRQAYPAYAPPRPTYAPTSYPQPQPQQQPAYGYAPPYAPQSAPQPAPRQAYPQPQPAQQAARPQASYPSPYQPQPYYAPAPAAPMAAAGSTATAPSGVYPANTVPPQLASPMAVPPQQSQPMVTYPQPPTSIYAPPPPARVSQQGQAAPVQADPRQPQRVAMNAAQPSATSSKLYSLHRQFGLQPDPTPSLASSDGPAVQLVSAIDSGVGAEPAAEPRNRVIQSNGKTTVLRGATPADPDSN